MRVLGVHHGALGRRRALEQVDAHRVAVQPGALKSKVGALNLLKSQHIAVEVAAGLHIGHHPGDVVDAGEGEGHGEAVGHSADIWCKRARQVVLDIVEC